MKTPSHLTDAHYQRLRRLQPRLYDPEGSQAQSFIYLYERMKMWTVPLQRNEGVLLAQILTLSA